MNVNAVNPTEGTSNGGEEVVITGDGFAAGATVTFGAAPAAVLNITPTEIRVTSPQVAPGPAVAVTVLNLDATTANLPGAYTFRAPRIDAISVASGPSAGDTEIVVTGAFFEAGADAEFNGTAAAGITVDSETQITLTSPAEAPGAANLTIVGPDGAVSNAVVFTFNPPAVTGLDVVVGPSGGGTVVTITGTDFHPNAVATFNNLPVLEQVVDSDTQIRVITGEVPAGAATLRVHNPDVRARMDNAFTFHAPVYAAIEPGYGPPAGGTNVKITGQWFGSRTTVEIDGTASPKVWVESGTTLYAEVPPRVAGAAQVNVDVRDANEHDDGVNRFRYAAQAGMGTDDVRFLMDGEEYFEQLRVEMARVRVAAPAANTYVRIAFWKISPTVSLGDRAHYVDDAAVADPTLDRLVNAIGQVINAGHKVDVIVWYPNLKDRKGKADYREFAEEHEEFARLLKAKDDAVVLAGGAGQVRVFLERYEGYTGSSNHQKIAIFSIAGQRTAIVGGFNLANYYWDSAAHDLYMNQAGDGGWHDTGVRIEGPSTDDIEAEWMRRWNRAVAMQRSLVTLNDLPNQVRSRYTGVGSRNTIRAAAVAITPNTTPQNAPAPTTSAVIRLTRSNGATRHRALRDELLTRIGNANHYVYMENNQFTDPGIVRALYQRKAAQPALRILIVTNASGGAAGYLARRSWLQMVLRMQPPALQRVYYTSSDGSERHIDRAGAASWAVHDSYQDHEDTWITATLKPHQRWLTNDSLEIPRDAGGTKKVTFSRITKVEGDFHFYTPYCLRAGALENPCVHSKLAIIDDEHLVVGTSNWTYRSMQYDGEIASFMNSPLPGAAPTLVTTAKDRILAHFDARRPLWLCNAGDNFETVTVANLRESATPDDVYFLFPLVHAENAHGDQRDPPGIKEMPSFIWL